MKRFLSIFRSPVALGGAIAAVIVLAVAAAAVVTGGFSLAQETPTAGMSTPKANDAAATPTTGSKDTSTPAAGATPSTKQTLREDFLNNLAKQLGISRDQLNQAIKQSASDVVDQALADGRITQAEADRIRQAITNGKLPFFGNGGRGHRGEEMFEHFAFSDIATFLGITQGDLKTALMNGQSLTQIAEAHGKSRDDLKAQLLSDLDTKLKQAVTDNKITQAQADQVRQRFSSNIDTFIDRQGPPMGMEPFDHWRNKGAAPSATPAAGSTSSLTF